MQQGERTEALRHDRGSSWSALLLVLLCCAVHANSLHNGYHLDDFNRIVDNPELERVWPPSRHFFDPGTSTVLSMLVQYRPLLPLTLSLDFAVADALGLPRLVMNHVVNLGLQALSSVLVYWLLLELLLRWPGWAPAGLSRSQLALAAAAAYAVHPVAGVPVNYLCARDLLLMQVFLLAALLSYVMLRRLERSRIWWSIPALLLVLSLLSKTNAVAAPLLVLFFEISFGQTSPWSFKAWRRVAPSIGIVAGVLAFPRFVLGFSDAGQLIISRPALEYPLTQLAVHVRVYLRNFMWPFRMRPLALEEPATGSMLWMSLLGLLLLLASVAVAWRVRKKAPLMSFALGAYWGLLALTSSLIPMRQLSTDYRQYASLPWLCLLAIVALASLPWARVARVAPVLLVVWFAFTAVDMDRVWATEETLWHQSVRYGGTTTAHHNYAMAVMGRDPSLAEEHFERALELFPGNVRTHVSLGFLLMREGREEEGFALVAKTVSMTPSWGMAHYWYSRALTRVGRRAEARAESAEAARLEARNPTYALLAATDAQSQGDDEACLEFLEQYHGLTKPGQSLFVKAWSLYRLGRLEEAIASYREFLRLRPGHYQARFNLGFTLKELGRCEEAVPELERALLIAPAEPAGHLHLARCLSLLGRSAAAAEQQAAWDRRAGAPAITERAAPSEPDRASRLSELYARALQEQAEGKDEACLETLRILHGLREHHEQSRFVEAWSLHRLGRLEEAVPSYRLHLEQDPDDVKVLFNLGHALMRLERHAEAVPEFERCLQLMPGRVAAHLHLSRCLAELGQEAEARVHAAAWDESRERAEAR